MQIDGAKKLFTPVPGWLNTASYGLPPMPAWEALQTALDDWRHGRDAWANWTDATVRSRSAFARLVGVPVSDVSVGAQVSQMLATVASSLPDRTRVVAPVEEFASNLFPWLVHEKRGFQVRTVAAGNLVEAIDDDTDVVAFSLVQSASGEVADVDAIVAAAHAVGAITVVDATQACGWLPVDAGRFDATVVGAYKWLLSPRGTGFLVTSPQLRQRLVPIQAGWFAGEEPSDTFYGPPLRLAADARRLDISPAWFSWVGTAPALELLEQVGIEAIRDHDVRLANRFRAGVGMPPGDSAIVSTDVPHAGERLDAAGVRAAVRDGKVRVSFHLYTTDADVDLALDAIS